MDILNYIFGAAFVATIAAFLIYWLIVPILTTPFFISSIKDMLATFELAKLQSTDRMVDLGSGDGRVVLAASRVCDYAEGVEINPFLTLFARFMAVISANGSLRFKNQDFWQVDLSSFDVVFIYLSPSSLWKLKLKLAKELQSGTRIVSHSFKIKGWNAVDTIKVGKKTHYLYIMGQQT